MKEIILNGENWQTKNDFYLAFFEAVGAPDWHGRNLDALDDSIGTGNINKIDLPYKIIITGFNKMGEQAKQIVNDFESLVKDLQSEGKQILIEIKD